MGKKQNAPKALEKITPSAIEISVAKNGFLKQYVVCFQHMPDNIAREPLGMLAGVLAIGNRSESSAYIVNFLASLAKKEYYGNPRRNAVESFEACLHKVNLGLAELTKEGNTEWIGTLDAALCVIERNNLHFSVAGNAKTLLFREKHMSVISDGLAEEDSENPIKTFTDIASGKICSGDRILITTPELFSITSESELERVANRLPGESFERFLQTAIINKLDFSATVVIDIQTVEEYKKPLTAPKRILATPGSVPNAWSNAIFESSKQQGNSIKETLQKEKSATETERVDGKTGHIYITGETPEEETSEVWEKFHIFLEDTFSIFARVGKTTGNTLLSGTYRGTTGLWNVTLELFSKTNSSIQTRWARKKIQKALDETLKETSKKNQLEETIEPETITEVSQTKLILRSSDQIVNTFVTLSRKTFHVIRNLPRPTFQKNQSVHVPIHSETESSENKKDFFKKTFDLHDARKLFALKNLLSQKQKRVVISCAGALIGLVLILLFFQQKQSVPTEIPEQTIEQPALPPPLFSNEKNIHFVENATVIFKGNDIKNILQLKDLLVIVASNSLFVKKNETEAVPVNYPEGTTALLGTVMPDLNAILILTENGKLYFYTPKTGTFSEEKIALPNTKSITDLGTFSTYLYVTDESNDALYRYPRVPGGFGAQTSWLKEYEMIEKTTKIAVGEALYFLQTEGISVYSKGTRKNILFEAPVTAVSLNDVFVKEDNASIFILDGISGRIIEYNAESGNIITQYANDSLKGASQFTIDTPSQTAFVSSNDTVFMMNLQ